MKSPACGVTRSPQSVVNGAPGRGKGSRVAWRRPSAGCHRKGLVILHRLPGPDLISKICEWQRTNNGDVLPVSAMHHSGDGNVTCGRCMIRCMSAPVASPRVRALSAALRQARLDAGIGQRELARQLDIQHAKLSYWESGRRVPDVAEVAAILAKLNIIGKERDRILELAQHAAEPNWLAAGVPGMSPGLAGVVDCEKTASSIIDWSPLLIPGLLQTSDYARAVLSTGLEAHESEPRAMMRIARRDVLTRNNPVELVALIHECVLAEVIGSCEIQVDQLRHVLSMAELPNVTVQIVRHGQGWHPGLSGPFLLFDFAKSPSIVHIEHHRSSAFLYDEKDVEDYKAATEMVRGVAMSPADSKELIANITNKLESTV